MSSDKSFLLIDANNLLFRARYSFLAKKGFNNAIAFSFFRSIKPIIQTFNPTAVFFVLDGKPQKRLEQLGTYKGTRVRHNNDGFTEQRKLCIDMIKQHFPFCVTRNPLSEADDVIGFLSENLPSDSKKIIVSTDTDFIQIPQKVENCYVWSPIKKNFLEIPSYDYILWKSLRGDPSDNISGVNGVGNKRATQFTEDLEKLEQFFNKKPGARELVERNKRLISFERMEASEVEMYYTSPEFDGLREKFLNYGFKSLCTEKSWIKYKKAFEELEDGRNYFRQ